MTKKQELIVAGIVLAAFIIGIAIGANIGYAKGHSAGVTETQQSYNPNSGN